MTCPNVRTGTALVAMLSMVSLKPEVSTSNCQFLWIGRFMQRRRLMSRPLADLLVVRRVALPRRSWSLTTRAVEGARRDAHMGVDCGSAGAVCTRLDQVRDRPASGDQPPDGAGVPEGTAGAGPAGAVRAGGVRSVRRVRPAAAGRRPASVGQHAVRRADGAGLCR